MIGLPIDNEIQIILLCLLQISHSVIQKLVVSQS